MKPQIGDQEITDIAASLRPSPPPSTKPHYPGWESCIGIEFAAAVQRILGSSPTRR